MAEGYFSVDGLQHQSDIFLDENRILGGGGPGYPRLSIPIRLTLRPDPGKLFTLVSLKCGLFLENVKIGEGLSDPLAEYSWEDIRQTQITIEIPLDLYRIEKIEEKRRGKINFRLEGNALVILHPNVVSETDLKRQIPQMFREMFRKARFSIDFTIPQSHWADTILPGLGYGKVQIVEIPIPEKILPDIFKKYQDELVHANDYFRQGDFDKAVAHCRSALELFHPEKGKYLIKLKELLTDSEIDWVKGVEQATYEWIEKIYKETYRISSKAVHTPSINFDRFEAQSTLMVTTALLSYSATIVTQKEKSE